FRRNCGLATRATPGFAGEVALAQSRKKFRTALDGGGVRCARGADPMNPDRRRHDKESIHDSAFYTEDLVEEEVTKLDLHRSPNEETLPPDAPETSVCARCGAELQCLTTIAWCLRCGYTKQIHTTEEATTEEMQEDLDVRRYLSLLHAQVERQKLE